jgi:hypothetical protein
MPGISVSRADKRSASSWSRSRNDQASPGHDLFLAHSHEIAAIMEAM